MLAHTARRTQCRRLLSAATPGTLCVHARKSVACASDPDRADVVVASLGGAFSYRTSGWCTVDGGVEIHAAMEGAAPADGAAGAGDAADQSDTITAQEFLAMQTLDEIEAAIAS